MSTSLRSGSTHAKSSKDSARRPFATYRPAAPTGSAEAGHQFLRSNRVKECLAVARSQISQFLTAWYEGHVVAHSVVTIGCKEGL
jgi:hypothetical protein